AAGGPGRLLIACSGAVGVVVGLLALVGAGQAVLVIAAHTMLQRVVAAQVVGRVFGMVEGLSMAGLALGAGLTPLLIHVGGYRLALIVIGGLLPGTAPARSKTPRRPPHGRTLPLP